MNYYQKFSSIVTLVAIWTLLFEFVNVAVRINHSNKSKQIDTKNRIISIVHGFLAFWLCSIALVIQPNLLSQINSHTSNLLMLISLSYFIYDTVACYFYKMLDLWLVFHHFVCIVSLSMLTLGRYSGSYYMIVTLALAQISNFPMHLRLILKNIGLKYTKLYELSENLYFFLYILARGVISPFFMLLPCLMDKKIHPVLKLMSMCLQAQSFYFIYEMISIVKSRIIQRLQMSKKNIDFDWLTVQQQKLRELSFYKNQ